MTETPKCTTCGKKMKLMGEFKGKFSWWCAKCIQWQYVPQDKEEESHDDDCDCEQCMCDRAEYEYEGRRECYD